MDFFINILLGNIFNQSRTISLEKASNNQGLTELRNRLTKLVPDISDQYSMFKVDNHYLKTKVRNLHAFQMILLEKVIRNFKKIVVVDIGDSSGTHLQYLTKIYKNKKDIKCLSVNLDQNAVEKIRNKGFEVVNARAEELNKYNISADVFLCFELLEHLTDPIHFLYKLSSQTNSKFLIVTVPFLRKSRVGLHHIRMNTGDNVCAENTHIFELCPEDWKLIVKQAGWTVDNEQIYLQYPSSGLFRFTKSLWRKFDYEGFYGMILKRDPTWSNRYTDWKNS